TKRLPWRCALVGAPGSSSIPAASGAVGRMLFWCAGRCQFCPAGWLWDAGHCYYFSSAKKTWEQSKEDCCSREAQLVTIRANATLVRSQGQGLGVSCLGGAWALQHCARGMSPAVGSEGAGNARCRDSLHSSSDWIHDPSALGQAHVYPCGLWRLVLP
uniref:CLC4F protein n=1 Tax=Dromaius novaehollandiae TaxID=8790 RepID=A0A8C4PC71_DRONO